MSCLALIGACAVRVAPAGGVCAGGQLKRNARQDIVKVPKPHQSKTGARGSKSTTQKQTSRAKKLAPTPRGPCSNLTAVGWCSLGSFIIGRTSAFPGRCLTRSTSLSLFSVCVALKAFMNYDFIVAAGSQINESCRCKAARRRSGFLPRAALLSESCPPPPPISSSALIKTSSLARYSIAISPTRSQLINIYDLDGGSD